MDVRRGKKEPPPDLLTFNATETTEQKEQHLGWTQFGDNESTISTEATNSSTSTVSRKTTTTTTTTTQDNDLLSGLGLSPQDFQSQKSGDDLFGDGDIPTDSLFETTVDPEKKQKKLEQSKNSILEKFKQNKNEQSNRNVTQQLPSQNFLTQLPPSGLSGFFLFVCVLQIGLGMNMGMVHTNVSTHIVNPNMGQYGASMTPINMNMNTNLNMNMGMNNGYGLNFYSNPPINQYNPQTQQSFYGTQPNNS
ncbi:hypothetical protein RFI_07385 [Reticulomyxa filosa]|uniref:Uncharacterized protein n=1 Tax=Reticulomyxa filosa TaxID=46433 RepID=X6NVA3_RETFI|nr:hypothetical protein RFI_07385 [Reticulomyxa filosa]|eukprot:ETO29734.1 hypothetical protein RFI_07385 [Reticulomyxa filosa]